ncbi:MAG TPA: 23S ribosomal RNA methyltransferase Erm [Actinopolymorphaceae bacterium]
MPSPYAGGRHELGQNFLVDRSVIDSIRTLVERTDGPILELGPGDGALTLPLSRTGRPLTAVEVDPRRARRLRQRVPDNVAVVNGDMLRHPFPEHRHVLVANLPFHLTTAMLRRLMVAETWDAAILLVQWEVARRRAGVGGASMMTASWWPWYEFRLDRRVPSRAFRPVPSVDGGLLTVGRRPRPLVAERGPYQRFVGQVFTGRGHGLRDILDRTGRFERNAVRGWLRDHRVSPHALPKDLTAEQWASLWLLASARGRTPDRRRQAKRTRVG